MNKKDLHRYYSISDVAEMYDVTPTQLRYWERFFPSLCKNKSRSGIRQYTKEDLVLIQQIYALVVVKGVRVSMAAKMIKSKQDSVVKKVDAVNILLDIKKELQEVLTDLDNL